MIRGFHLADFLTLGNAGCGIHDHQLALLEVARGGDPDDSDDRLLASEDRGVRRRPAFGRDEREHLVEVEERGVGGCEVLRHEHERVARVGDARRGDAPQPRYHALRHLVEIGGALAEVSAQRGQLVAE